VIGYRPLAHWAMAVSSRSATASTERNCVMLICAVFGAVYIYICMVSGGAVRLLRSAPKRRRDTLFTSTCPHKHMHIA
jgi:hypothetical protein